MIYSDRANGAEIPSDFFQRAAPAARSGTWFGACTVGADPQSAVLDPGSSVGPVAFALFSAFGIAAGLWIGWYIHKYA